MRQPLKVLRDDIYSILRDKTKSDKEKLNLIYSLLCNY